MELLQTVQLTCVLMQEQYAFLYEVLLEGLLCGSTGVPVESVASHVRCLREAETSRHNNVLEKEFKVPPGSGALGLVLRGVSLWCLPPTALLPSFGMEMGEHFSGVAEEGEKLTGGTCLAESSLQALQKFSELFQLLPCREAEKPTNQLKNRKPGILPGIAGQPLALRPSA